MSCTLSRFKDGVPVNTLNAPGKYKIESKYGVHGLIISRLVSSSPSPSHSLHPSTLSSPHPSISSSISPTHPSISPSHHLSSSIASLHLHLSSTISPTLSVSSISLLSPSLSLRLYLYLSTTISVFSISYLLFSPPPPSLRLAVPPSIHHLSLSPLEPSCSTTFSSTTWFIPNRQVRLKV